MAQEQDRMTVELIADTRNVEKGVAEADRKIQDFRKKAAANAKVQIRLNIAKLEQSLDEARKRLRDFKKEGDKQGQIKTRLEIAGLRQNVTSAKKVLRDLGAQAGKTQKSFFSLNGIVKDLLKAFTGFFILNEVKLLFQNASRSAIEFEAAFTGVRKTVDASDEEFKILEKTLFDLAKQTGTSVNDLAKIGELGGQLGVGIQDLEEFIKVIDAVSVSTNLTAEDASLAFARIANILDLPINQVENLGSAIVGLGNNFAARESEITNFTNRIAAAGKIAGFTVGDITGVSTALTSVGVEAEAGGTAVQKSLLQINKAVNEGGKDLENFAKVTGKSAKEFADLWEKDAGQAFAQFVNGLGAAGDDAGAILGELIGEDVRLQRAFLSLAGAGDLVNRAIAQGNVEFEKNTALQEEAAKFYNQTGKQLDAQKQRFNQLLIQMGRFLNKGLLPLLEFLNDLIEDLATGSKHLGYFGDAIKLVTTLILAMVASGVITSIGVFFAAIVTGATTATAAFSGMAASIAAVKAAILALPISWTIVVALVGGKLVFDQINKLKEAIGAAQDAALDAQLAAGANADREVKRIQKLKAANRELAKDAKKNAKEIEANNKVIAASNAKITLAQIENNKQRLNSERLTNNFVTDTFGKKRKSIDAEIASLELWEETERKRLKQIVGSYDDATRQIVDDLQVLEQQTKEVGGAEFLPDAPDADDILGGAAATKKAAETIKEAIKEAADELETYEKLIEETRKDTAKLASDTKKFYSEIAESIAEATDKQKDLLAELDAFKSEEIGGFVNETAKRDLKLAEEEKTLKEEINALNKEIFKDEEDRQRIAKERAELEEELKDVTAERKQITTFISDSDEGFAEQFKAQQEFLQKSQFEQDKIALANKIRAKEEEVALEIQKQQELLDVQQRFLDIFDKKSINNNLAKARFNKFIKQGLERDEEEFAKFLEEQGFKNLTKEQELELLKQAEKALALENEKKQIESQQQAIYELKDEYFKLTEVAFSESVDRQKEKMDELITQIRLAQQEQRALNALRGEGVADAVGSSVDNSRSTNVVQNIANEVDAESALNQLLNKVK